MGAAILLLHIVGWGSLFAILRSSVLPADGSSVFGLGLGVTAYVLGMRHAFDADHIAAIDTTTRKLLSDGGRPLSVGFWFSLGHSSVVFVLCALLALGLRSLAPQLRDEDSALQQAAGVLGTMVSGLFLVALGLLNLILLVQVIRVFRKARKNGLPEAELEQHLQKRGVINRILRPLTRAVKRPGQMYPIGLLFGLGFDTATEISLLVLAGGAAVATVPWYAVLTLPILFAAGMCLFDTLDGAVMHAVYSWAYTSPLRKLLYNIAITALSVTIALVIGGQELIALLTEKLGITDGVLGWIAGVDFEYAGFGIVGVFLILWLVAAVTWKYRGRLRTRVG